MAKEMKISKESQEELIKLSRSEALRKDMETITLSRHNPFIKEGKVDADAFIEFVTQYNEFINHAPKPFAQIVDKYMKL
jgi:hypothetical protein